VSAVSDDQDDDRADELAQDALWRARHGLPGQAASALDAIRERNPELAEQILSGDLPPDVYEQIGRDFLERAGDTPLPPELAQLVQNFLAAASGPPDPAPTTVDDVRAAVEAGEPCDRLFAIRNAMAPHDPANAAANKLLRAVGCHSSGSRRPDLL
jgi:hypothetical protein